MSKLLKFLLRINIPFSILILVFGVIIVSNFPHTWYTGWDNLHPEFNFGLNLWRAFTSVWQPNQGLGTFGGHGYAATLPHTLVLYILSIFLPDIYLRSIFTFACLFLGGTGIFFLTRTLLAQKVQQIKDFSSLLAGLFYILNYATIQNFYIQLEAFIVHFAALPWLFYTIIKFLEKRTWKRFLLFLFVSFITSVQGFIPPLFLVFVILLSIFLLLYVLEKISLQRIKISIIVFLATIIVNAYWLFPVGYYTFTRSDIYLNSYNNISSTENFLEKNKKYGTMDNIVRFRGFLSEAIDIKSDGTVFNIFYAWELHKNTKFAQLLSFILFLMVVLGGIKSIFKKDSQFSGFFLAGFLLSLTFLATNTFPFSAISEVLQNLPVFKQAFRISFTKFSIAFVFFCSILFGLGFSALLSLIFSIERERVKKLIFSVAILAGFISVVYLSLPVFSGNLLYSRTKIEIPSTYFQLFDYFKNQNKNQRIANFPQGWNWGWSVYEWGYSGSGFLWYGIEQPIMDRSFDVWGDKNENYYWETYNAIFSQRFHLVDNLMEKYQIQWLIFDENVSPYLNPYEFNYVTELKNYVQTSKKFKLEKVIKGSNKKTEDIYIYKINLNKQSEDFKAEFKNTEINNIGPKYLYNNSDYAFDDFGHYYIDETEPYSYYYAFRSLFDHRKLLEFPLEVKQNNDSITLTGIIPASVRNYPLAIPPVDENFIEDEPEVNVSGNKISVKFKKINHDSYNSKNDTYFLNHKATGCDKPKKDWSLYKQEATKTKNLRFTTYDAENCYAIILDRISQRSSYLIEIESKNVKGTTLQFAVINHDSRKADVDVKLPKNKEFESNYLFLPPMKEYGAGYSLHFQDTSIGKSENINELKKVSSYVIPYNFMSGMVFSNPQKPKNNGVFAFFQSYDSGWAAYEINTNNRLSKKFPFLKGKKLNNHVLVNNWANGWIIDGKKCEAKNNCEIVVIFFPQYLQYIGYFLSIGSLIAITAIVLSKSSSRKKRLL